MASTSKTPSHECPRYEACSCNVCPLDPSAAQCTALPGEQICGAWRRIREAIAAKHPTLLPGGGLLPKDRARDARKAAWAALPADDPRKAALRRAQKT